MDRSPPPPRPPWARRLDGWVLRLARLGGRLLGRPSEATLGRLARRDRPSPPIAVPRPEDLGVTDPLADGRRALELGRPAEALHHFGQLLAEHPDHPWGWHGRGDALQAMAEPEGALEAYRRAAELQPRQGLHRGGECNALSALGRSAEAEVARQAALSLDPSLLWMWEGATAGARRRPGG